MEAEKEFNKLCGKLKVQLNREMNVLMTEEEANPSHYKLAIDNLSQLAVQVSAIEKSSLKMWKKAPNCATLINKQGYFGPKSIFLKMTEHLRVTLLSLKKTLLKKGGNKKLVSKQIEKVLNITFVTFEHDPIKGNPDLEESLPRRRIRVV